MLRKSITIFIVIMLFCVLLCGCGESADAADSSGQTVPRYNTTLDASSPEETSKTDYVGKRDSTPEVLEPAADGTTVYSNDYAAIDASHTDQGYVMAQYTGDCPKVKLQVIGPGKDETYTYLMKPDNSWQTFPFSCGDGNYTVRILENVEGSSYAISLTQELSVSLENEFLPFLYPNQYVSFDKNSLAVEKGASLAKSADTDLDAVSNIYHYVIENITYDTEKAETVQYGYTPDVDDTLESGTGICFDYAALMTTMLRTQRIPTRLDVGYSGEAYHAWISTYIEDVGWIDDIIEFDGKSWKLMDPTLAANNNSSAVGKYIGDGTNYTLKYSY